MNIVRLAAAGAGKTWGICREAISISRDPLKRILLLSYTNKCIESIRAEVEKQNGGIVPKNINIMSWYQFLLNELIKPYQTYIAGINEIKSLDFSLEHDRNYEETGTKERYITSENYVRSEEASNLCLFLNDKSGGKLLSRLEQIYSHLFIDEIQDLAGRDLDILKAIFKSNITVTCVGDNKQAIFQTHTTRVNKKFSGANVNTYFSMLQDEGLADIQYSLCSRRFNKDICCFANRVYPNENIMTTSMNIKTNHDGVFIIEKKDAQSYFDFYHPQELRYNKRTTDICGMYAINFGNCKGKTFNRCLIYTNKPMINFLKGKPLNSPEKYYIAVTRARFSNTFIVDKLFDAPGFIQYTIDLADTKISAMKFTGNS